jgi:NAD(P)-dependent dehydrogenase (short-subunit alcohol dehydrogenase family)
MASQEEIAVVTGSSSGIGLETSLLLARNGFQTFATMRNIDKGKELSVIAGREKLPIKVVQLDVTDDTSVTNAIEKIMSEAGGRIDVLINNAGYGLGGAFEDSSMNEIKSQYETNVFGLMRVTQAVLPVMRKQESGIIVNISSGAGRAGYPGASVYVSSKFAIEGLSESIAFELEPFGIRVILVEPGVIRTNFANVMVIAKKSQEPNSPYSQMMQKISGNFQHMMENGADAKLVAQVVLNAITSEDPELRYVTGKDIEDWMEARKNMSDRQLHDMMKQNLLK